MAQEVERQEDPLLTILNAVAIRYINSLPQKELILTPAELKELLANATVRCEILDTTNLETSPIKLTIITVEQARKMYHDMKKIVTHKRKRS